MMIIIFKFEKGKLLLYRQKDTSRKGWELVEYSTLQAAKDLLVLTSNFGQKKENLEEPFIRDNPSWMVLMSLIYEFSLWRIQPLNWIAV